VTCDVRRTDTGLYSIYRASMALRGKNWISFWSTWGRLTPVDPLLQVAECYIAFLGCVCCIQLIILWIKGGSTVTHVIILCVLFVFWQNNIKLVKQIQFPSFLFCKVVQKHKTSKINEEHVCSWLPCICKQTSVSLLSDPSNQDDWKVYISLITDVLLLIIFASIIQFTYKW